MSTENQRDVQAAVPQELPVVGTGQGGTSLALLLLIVGMTLRLAGAVWHPFEQDEMYTLLESRDLFATTLLPGINARPLYYLLQHPLLAWIPPDDLRWLRTLPLVFAAGGMWLTWLAARRVGGRVAGLVALGAAVVSPWHLYASEFARYWSLVYLCAAGFLHFAAKGYDEDAASAYLAALAFAAVGAFTHPTFLFGAVGVVVGLHAVRASGAVAPSLPPRRAVTLLWAPLALVVLAGVTALVLTGNEQTASNFGGRGLRGTLMLLPAIVQWAQPVTVAAGCFGIAVCAVDPRTRRFGFAATGSFLSSLLLLFLAAWRTDAYADYAIGILPALFVGLGVLVSRLRWQTWSDRLVGAGVVMALLGGMLPSTLSHVNDGTRFDYRPAIAEVRRRDPERAVMGWPEILIKQYGTELRRMPYRVSPRALQESLDAEGKFWLILSAREYGYASIDRDGLDWVYATCIKAGEWQRLRLDVRRYRVELFSCEATG